MKKEISTERRTVASGFLMWTVEDEITRYKIGKITIFKKRKVLGRITR